jgi:hypothetical protein
MAQLRISIPEGLMDAYFNGVMYAAHYFAQRNPDWRDRPLEMAVFSVQWPYTVARDVAETLSMLLL